MQLPERDDSFAWARSPCERGDWLTSAKRWALLRQVYTDVPVVLFNEIDCNIQANQLTLAEQLITLASEEYPKHAALILSKAKLALKQGMSDKALQLLKLGQEAHSDRVEMWIDAANLCIENHDFKSAEDYNAKAREISNGLANVWIQYAEIAMAEHLWEEALNRWSYFRSQFPTRPIGYLRAAEAATKLGNYRLARKLRLALDYGSDLIEEEYHEKEPTYVDNSSRKQHPLLKYSELVWVKAILGLRSEVQRNYLSYIWWLLEPLLHMTVYYVVFMFMLQRGNENYVLFLLTGLVPFMWFNKTINACSNSIISAQGLMQQLSIPSIIFPFVSILQSTLKQIPVFFILICFVIYSKDTSGWQLFLLIPILVAQLLFTITAGCVVAALIPFMRDLTLIIPTGLTFLMFLSGIFYSYSDIPERWHTLFLSNPVALFIKSYRDVLLYNHLPNFSDLFLWAVISVLIFSLTLFAYSKLRYVFPRVVIS